MSNGATTRSKWQTQCEAHLKHAKEHPEWMGQAVVSLKAWGDGTMTLQHAFAVALQAAYEAGTRGEYPEPIDFFDTLAEPAPDAPPKRMARSRPAPVVTRTRMMRTR